MKTCAEPNCTYPVFSNGYCRGHQYRNPKADRRTPLQKYQDNIKSGKADKAKPRNVQEAIDDVNIRYLVDDLDALFSKYIRLKYADENGYVKCFTCPIVLPVAEIENGHYGSRSNMSIRFSEAGCRPQCPKCNSMHEIDRQPFKAALECEQSGVSEFLDDLEREVSKPSRHELKGMILDYRAKLKVLEKAKLKK